MHVLDNAVVKERYDVVVVGAGIGGLTSAALLAKRGLDVLVVEQHSLPGGCCSALRRQDVAMDVGATILYGFGERGLNAHRYVMNELGEDIEMIRRESILRLHFNGKPITFWYNFDRFFAEVVALFPTQEAELAKFFEYGRRVYEATILKGDFIVPPTEIPPERMLPLFGDDLMFEMFRWQGKTGLELFQEFFDDPEVIDFFDMLTRIISYVDAAECPALLSLTMFADNHVGGAFYPQGGPQMLPNKLERAIERFGGQIVYRQRVREVDVQGGRARGVVLEGGRRIAAQHVIANATIWNLYGKLIPAKHVSKKRKAWADSFEPSHSNLILYIQADRALLKSRDLQPLEILVEDAQSVEGHGITIYLPSMIDPSVAPPELCSITITCVSSSKWPKPSDPEYRGEQYQKQKQAEADVALARVETLIPGFRGYIRGMEIATPPTLERFTDRNWGTVGGPKQAMGQDMFNRPSARTDIKNLMLTGDSTVMGIGVLPCTISAVGAANAVLKDLGEECYFRREFETDHIHIGPGKELPARIPVEAPITTDTEARRLARDCNHCEVPTCVEACPASIDLVGFLRRVEAGNFEGAAREMREMNPLAETCGTACPSERYCEAACIHNDIDGVPVQISKIHGYVCGAVTGLPDLPTADEARKERIAIVGAGPAGLSCAHFLGRAGFLVDLLDRNARPGGMLTHAVDPDSLSEETFARELNIIDYPTVRLKSGVNLGEQVSLGSLRRDYDAVFLAPGLWQGRSLQLPGGEGVRTQDALSLLRERRDAAAGRSAKLDVGARVVVVGGGSVGFDAATAAQDAGAESVTLVCPEGEAALPMLASEQKTLRERGIAVEAGWMPRRFEQAALVLVGCDRVTDADGRFAPQLDEERTLKLAADHYVWAVGQVAEPGLAAHLQQGLGASLPLAVDSETQRVQGESSVYAGGDISRGAGTIVEAVADGRRAARAIHAELEQRRTAGPRLGPFTLQTHAEGA